MINRWATCAFVALSLALVACGADDDPSPLAGRKNVTSAPPPSAAPQADATSPAEAACAALGAPTRLSDAKSARDITLAGRAIFFQSGSSVVRVFKDGVGKKDVFSSLNLTHSFVDDTAIVTVESSTDNPNATLRVIKATNAAAAPKEGEAAPPKPEYPEFPVPEVKDGVDLNAAFAALGTTTATNFNAGGTRVFASDATSFFLLADTATGPAILHVSKDNPATQTTIVTLTDHVIDSPQLASGAIWYVRDNNRVFKVTLADEATGAAQGEPTEVFGIGYASCSLAVGDAAFCSIGSSIERRDLTGANPTTVLDVQKSVTPAPFGRAIDVAGSIIVSTNQPDPKLKHILRVVSPGAQANPTGEKLLACGRDLITAVAADATHAVWIEANVGVFITSRP